MFRADIISEARKYLVRPTAWRHMGRTITGVDCIGLICGVADAVGVSYEDISGYSRNPDGRFVDHVLKFTVFRQPQTVAPGCVVIFRDAHQPCHIGIITEKYGQLYLLHSSLAKRHVVEEEYDVYWQRKFRCALDFPGVED